jgi:uncharacterized peroxidase-related enzyme
VAHHDKELFSMLHLPVHTLESAPPNSRSLLAAARAEFGFVPNLLGELAGAPAALDAYLTLGRLLSETSLRPVEQQIIVAAVSVANGCSYCVAAHTPGLKMAGLSDDQVAALRAARPLADARLESVRRLASAFAENRGWVSDDVLRDFLETGHRREQVLEVLVGVAMKTLSNYTNHVAGTPLDRELQPFAWEETSATGR